MKVNSAEQRSKEDPRPAKGGETLELQGLYNLTED